MKTYSTLIEDYMKERKTWKRNEPLLKSQKEQNLLRDNMRGTF